jgi:hypothetical protein
MGVNGFIVKQNYKHGSEKFRCYILFYSELLDVMAGGYRPRLQGRSLNHHYRDHLGLPN